MKRPGTLLAAGLVLPGILLLASLPGVQAGQQTFSSVSSGTAPAPFPTPTGLLVSGVYFGIYPGYGPYHPTHPCTGGHCHPVRPPGPPPVRPPLPPPVRPPTPTRPAPPVAPRPVPLRP
jgi:hypothetical protein